MDQFVEPSLAEKPSYRDHNGSPYGVLEHMQALGEAPNARVKARVKPDGGRKSVIGRSAAAVGLDAQETPEGTPAPQATTPAPANTPSQPRIVVDDERDENYAPNAAAKKKERATRTRAVKRSGDTASAPQSTVPPKDKPQKVIVNRNKKYNAHKLKQVVEAARERAMEVGKPDLAEAVHEIYQQSLTNAYLTELLENILTQSATPTHTAEFQNFVRAAKKKLKDAKQQETRNIPASSANGTQSLPLRSPSKFTSAENTTSAIPSTEQPELKPPKVSLKVRSPSKQSGRRRSGHSGTMSASPTKKRSNSADSDSSLTDMTSNPDDDMDVDEPDELGDKIAGPSSTVNGIKGKDHAAERGSLAAPNRNLKRSSADAEFQDDEQDRTLAKKKLKLSETVSRDYSYEESNIRRPPTECSSRLRSLRGKNGTLAPPSLSLPNGSRNASIRGSRAVSTDIDSPLSELSPASSRQSTPHVWKGPAKTFGKKAKTKQS